MLPYLSLGIKVSRSQRLSLGIKVSMPPFLL
jgi:hypothetical protein